jgi:signal transduction histidine kinase
LAVSRRIVERHRGRIDVSASDAGGARFQLTMPIADETNDVATA